MSSHHPIEKIIGSCDSVHTRTSNLRLVRHATPKCVNRTLLAVIMPAIPEACGAKLIHEFHEWRIWLPGIGISISAHQCISWRLLLLDNTFVQFLFSPPLSVGAGDMGQPTKQGQRPLYDYGSPRPKLRHEKIPSNSRIRQNKSPSGTPSTVRSTLAHRSSMDDYGYLIQSD